MPESTLVLDVGGQGCRALAVDDTGCIRASMSQDVSTRESAERVEQDADELAAALAGLAAEVATRAESLDAPVTRAALAVQRGSVACWKSSDSEALSPVISWRDRRCLPELARLSVHSNEIKHRSGLRFSPYGGATKLAWCLKHLPAMQNHVQRVGRSDRACGPLGSFLLARLLKGHPLRTDDTLAQRTLLWSREKLDWDEWLLEQFGLDRSMLPAVVPGRSFHGQLACTNAEVPLELLMGDQNAVPFVDGSPRSDTLYINLGTGAFLVRPLDQPLDDPRFQLSLLERGRGGRWALEASIHGAASALAWLGHEANGQTDSAVGLRQRCDRPPLFINTVDGLGSPWWCPGPEAGFIDDSGDSESRLLGVLESITFLVCANVEAMSGATEKPERIVLSGGLSQSATLCSLIADLLEISIFRLEPAEATCLGLWCHLQHRSLSEDCFRPVSREPSPALGERYRRWREYMPEMPALD